MIKIYHNSRCRKSREGLEFVKQSGKPFQIVEYMKNKLSFEDLKLLKIKLHIEAKEMVRTQEEVYKNQLKGKMFNEDEWLHIIVQHPNLLKRPIIEREHKAIIAENSEIISDFLNN
jgi:arsenate reductase